MITEGRKISLDLLVYSFLSLDPEEQEYVSEKIDSALEEMREAAFKEWKG